MRWELEYQGHKITPPPLPASPPKSCFPVLAGLGMELGDFKIRFLNHPFCSSRFTYLDWIVFTVRPRTVQALRKITKNPYIVRTDVQTASFWSIAPNVKSASRSYVDSIFQFLGTVMISTDVHGTPLFSKDQKQRVFHFIIQKSFTILTKI